MGRRGTLEDVRPPLRASGRVLDRAELARRPERVNDTVVPRGCGARAIASVGLAERRGPCRRPQFATRRDVVGGDDLIAAALLDRKCATACDDERRVAA